MLQKIAYLKEKAKMEGNGFFLSFFFSLFAPALIITLFSLLFLEGTQKSQLVLIAIAALLLSSGMVKYLLSGLTYKVHKEASSQIQAECKEVEDQTLLSHQQEIEAYREKIKERENSAIELQAVYDQKILDLQNELSRAEAQVIELNCQMEKKLDEIRLAYFEFEDVRAQMARQEEELKSYRMEAEEKIMRKESLINDYQHTIYEQRKILEKKQHYIIKLEAKVQDLMYEMRTLLQLEEPAPDPQITLPLQDEKSMVEYYLPKGQLGLLNNFDITTQLERYLTQAENFTGADHLGFHGGREPRFASQNNYQIDLRRLFDHLKDENGMVLFFFAPQERRFLFVNHYVMTLLGHTPEKFIYKFADLVEGGYSQWSETVGRLQEKKMGRCRLVMRHKEGEKKVLTCQMGLIGKGPFRGNVLGILAPYDASS